MHLLGILQCSQSHQYIYTVGMPKAWPAHANSIDPIGELTIYVFDIYNFHTSEFLQSYYHYR